MHSWTACVPLPACRFNVLDAYNHMCNCSAVLHHYSLQSSAQLLFSGDLAGLVQIYGEVCSHLKECFQNPLKTFTSWRALATYMTVLASRRKSPGRNHMQPFFLKIHKLIDIHASRVPESMLLALAQASLCDSNTFLQQRAMFSLATCAARFLDNPENVTTYRTRNNRISLYTFTAHRY